MFELTRISLENDMDLILAHRQGMKVAELLQLSPSRQTSFATAVSEVCRDIIGTPDNAWLALCISDKSSKTKRLYAIVNYEQTGKTNEGCQYAKKLVDECISENSKGRSEIRLSIHLPYSFRFDEELAKNWSILLNNDPAVSPYEEIKRKNKQLQELSEKLKASEEQYKSLTDSLPLMIFTLNKDGQVTYANKWLLDYTGQTIPDLNNSKWKNILHPEDFIRGWDEWEDGAVKKQPRTTERRMLDSATMEFKWHAGASIPVKNEDGNVICWNGFLVDVDARKKMEQALQDNKELKETKQTLEQKIWELNQSNEELEQFAYVASHDLQEPLRKISFYSDCIRSKYINQLPEEGQLFLNNIASASARMKQLIHDVLVYSTITEKKEFTTVDLNEVLSDAVSDNEFAIKEKQAVITCTPLPVIQGIPVQLRQLFENLLSNSLKFVAEGVTPVININSTVSGNQLTLQFKDNGIGFDEKYVDKMFDLFQRLHSREQFSGTGIGLGICKKIIGIHNGTIVASSSAGNGATFTIQLPLSQTVSTS